MNTTESPKSPYNTIGKPSVDECCGQRDRTIFDDINDKIHNYHLGAKTDYERAEAMTTLRDMLPHKMSHKQEQAIRYLIGFLP